jgi:sulfite exporter TauE/SafE
MTEGFIAAILMGLAGSGHCMGMCGGIAAAMGQQSSTMRVILFNLSRLISYALIAAILGSGVKLLSMEFKQLMPILRMAAGFLLVAMGLYMLDWWRGIQALERAGSLVWKHIQPLSSRLMQGKSLTNTLLLGLLWGFLPCGLVYSALSWAVSYQADINAAVLMLGFGIGTLPSMLGASFAGQLLRKFTQTKATKLLIAFSMIAFGVWTLAMPAMQMFMQH